MDVRSPPPSGNSTSVCVTMAPVGTWLVDTTAIVRSGPAGNLQDGLGQDAIDAEARALLLLRLAERHHREERRAVAAQARVVLVAGRLVDLRLAAELGLDRVDAQAVGLHAAVAAALAHCLVDDHPHSRVRQPAALAQPPLLRRAPLVVDERGHAGRVAQQLLRL